MNGCNVTDIKGRLMKAGELNKLCKEGRLNESIKEVVTKLSDGTEVYVKGGDLVER